MKPWARPIRHATQRAAWSIGMQQWLAMQVMWHDVPHVVCVHSSCYCRSVWQRLLHGMNTCSRDCYGVHVVKCIAWSMWMWQCLPQGYLHVAKTASLRSFSTDAFLSLAKFSGLVLWIFFWVLVSLVWSLQLADFDTGIGSELQSSHHVETFAMVSVFFLFSFKTPLAATLPMAAHLCHCHPSPHCHCHPSLLSPTPLLHPHFHLILPPRYPCMDI